jgi:fructose-bisphosphate aldolase/6-deoxy-5-ketofructose 1-phosphate synthase
MFFKKSYSIEIPADVPRKAERVYYKNYATITKNSENFMLFACDHKMEHLNKDFYGPHISPDAMHIEHIFKIASSGTIGALGTNVGLIARYGKKYPHIPYIAKLNGKTNLIKPDIQDPYSKQLWDVNQIVKMKEDTDINICGVGYTLYIGSEYEPYMLHEAAQIVNEAHNHGLITLLWIYARGKSISDDQDPMLITGIAGLAATLGADFVKTKPPHEGQGKTSAEWLKVVVEAAGNTKVIISGGHLVETDTVLKTTYDQIHTGGVAGVAIGRNILQRSDTQAIALTDAISSIVYQKADVSHAVKLYNSKNE